MSLRDMIIKIKEKEEVNTYKKKKINDMTPNKNGKLNHTPSKDALMSKIKNCVELTPRDIVKKKTPMRKKRDTKKKYTKSYIDMKRKLVNKISSLDKSQVVVGTNAVLRLLERNELDVVIFQQTLSPPLHDTLNLYHRKACVLLVLVATNDPMLTMIASKNRIKRISTIGVKKSAATTDEEFKLLLTKMKSAQDCDYELDEDLSNRPYCVDKFIERLNDEESTYSIEEEKSVKEKLIFDKETDSSFNDTFIPLNVCSSPEQCSE